MQLNTPGVYLSTCPQAITGYALDLWTGPRAARDDVGGGITLRDGESRKNAR